jgi:putative transposase
VRVAVPSYRGFRYPIEIISHCVWLYHQFPLRLREVRELMLARGVILSHLDEVLIKICGNTRYLWRAVDQYGKRGTPNSVIGGLEE